MICNFFKKLCEKREIKKIEKATVKPVDVPLPPIATFPKWFTVALNEIGVKEFPGEKHNPRIVEYHQSCDLKAKTDEIAWCSAFVNWCFLKSGIDFRTRSAASSSWRKWGRETNDPKIGDIVIFRRVDSDWRGHVGFFVAKDENRILVLGGNQGDEVCFQWYKYKTGKLDFFQFRSMQ